MNRTLTLLAVAVFANGCASTQSVSTFAPAERHLAARAQYYEDLNQRQVRDNIVALAEIDGKFAGARAEAQRLLDE